VNPRSKAEVKKSEKISFDIGGCAIVGAMGGMEWGDDDILSKNYDENYDKNKEKSVA
jgi:hypothetical protein